MRKNQLLNSTCRLLTLLLIAFGAEQAFAYNEDTHFYTTYAIARYAGIAHPVAAKMAMTAQWMDESYISDPMSMMVLPATGVYKRRMLHFPSYRVVGAANTATQDKITGLENASDLQKSVADAIAKQFDYKGDLKGIQIMTETTEDNPFASELFMAGLRAGDLMMASAGLHTLEDSYSHAGTPAEQGHAFFWDWPDRPFEDTAKYSRMTTTLFKAVVAIRSLLPADALDCSLRSDIAKPNCERDAASLAQSFNETPAVKSTFSYDALRDPSFIRVVVKDLLLRMFKAKYLKLDAPTLVATLNSLPLSPGDDSQAVVKKLLSTMVANEQATHEDRLHLTFMLIDMGRLRAKSTDKLADAYIRKFGFDTFISSITDELLAWRVPRPLTTSHRMELEDNEGKIRAQEMKIRNANMQTLIETLFGTRVEMIANPTKDEIGFAREILLDPTAESKIPVDPRVRYVTFTLHERNRFDNMIFKFLFPDLTEEDLKLIVRQAAKVAILSKNIETYNQARSAIDDNQKLTFVERQEALLRLRWKFGGKTGTARLAAAAADVVLTFAPMMPRFMKNLINTHAIPSPHNFDYRLPSLLLAEKNAGLVSPFLSEKDAWSLPALREFDRMQSGQPASTSP